MRAISDIENEEVLFKRIEEIYTLSQNKISKNIDISISVTEQLRAIEICKLSLFN